MKKNLDRFAPSGLGRVLHVRTSLSFGGCLIYICEGAGWQPSLKGDTHLCGVERRIGSEREEWLFFFLIFLSS
jgi:hypothetical protein